MEKIVCLLLLAISGIRAETAEVYNVTITTTRISEYVNANIGDFPYMVSLQKRYELTSHGHKCGGVLITLQHVMTAASCLYNNNYYSNGPIDSKDYRVLAGLIGLSNSNPEDARLIANFTIHPDFVGDDKHLNDIAILTLEKPFVANYLFKPLPLPEQDDDPKNHLYEDIRSSVSCTVAGWGKTSPDSYMHNALKYAHMSLQNLANCEALYPQMVHSPNASTSMVCAAGERSMTYGCDGDEGNPLVCNNRLVGILFLRHECVITSSPQLYTRVSHYTNWARSVIGIEKSSSTVFQPGFALVFILAVTVYKLQI